MSVRSFGALSEEAKVALAKGAELAGTGICSGEGGMLPEEQGSNSRYFYELASARFGFSWDKVEKTQAFHFNGGQGAKLMTYLEWWIPPSARARRHRLMVEKRCVRDFRSRRPHCSCAIESIS